MLLAADAATPAPAIGPVVASTQGGSGKARRRRYGMSGFTVEPKLPYPAKLVANSISLSAPIMGNPDLAAFESLKQKQRRRTFTVLLMD